MRGPRSKDKRLAWIEDRRATQLLQIAVFHADKVRGDQSVANLERSALGIHVRLDGEGNGQRWHSYLGAGAAGVAGCGMSGIKPRRRISSLTATVSNSSRCAFQERACRGSSLCAE